MSEERKARQRDLMAFVGLDAARLETLNRMAPRLEELLPGVLEDFYARLRAHPSLDAMFSSDAARSGAQDKQLRHWIAMAEDGFDDSQRERASRVGKIHADIGLPPDAYLMGYALVLDGLISRLIDRKAAASATARGGFFARPAPVDMSDLRGEVGALIRAAFLDMGLVISVYSDTLDQRRIEVEEGRKRDQDAQDRTLSEVMRVMKAVAAGDLTQRIRDDVPYGFRPLRDDINSALASLSRTIASVNARAATIENAIKNLAAGTAELSDRTSQQAASVEESSAVMNELSASVQGTARDAESASGTVENSRREAEESGTVVHQTSEAMAQIEARSAEIVKIVAMIDEIAFQTNLLSLNASVEAARAGETGRGFAVVATEVRNLAKRCADAAETIKSLVEASEAEVATGVELVGRTQTALESFIEDFSRIANIVTGIAGSAREQSTGLNEINAAVSQMDDLTQRNAVMVDETNANLQRLSEEVTSLTAALAAFNVGSFEDRDPARAA